MQQTSLTATRLDDAATELIGEHVRRLLSTIGLEDLQVTCDASEVGILRISIGAGEEGRSLIGAQGAHLASLQHIIRCVLRRHIESDVHILVDVNGYRARREKSLYSLAEEVARKAQRTGRPVAMSPMSALDRRTIHTALAAHKDIVTESMGDGPDRRVIVRPVFL
jgi:spoIIIJ-associated protein